MQDQFSRTRMLFGQAALDIFAQSHVAVFGIGGVGGYVTEALARNGIGALDIVDNDKVCESNINRQIYAMHSTIGEYKVDVAERRIKDINPRCTVRKHKMFYLPANADGIDLTTFDYVVDCIDTVSAKIEIARRCAMLGVPVISCMGAANKLDPTAFRITDITKTKMDPLAKVIRKKLKELRVPHLKVVYSEEPPLKPLLDGEHCGQRTPPASNAFVPATAGLIAAGEVIKDLLRLNGIERQP